MGNRGLPAVFFVLFDVKPMPKKQSPYKPAKLQAQIAIKTVVFEK